MVRRLSSYASAALWVIALAASSAQAAPRDLAECRAIGNDASRLACYDILAAATQASSTSPAPATPVPNPGIASSPSSRGAIAGNDPQEGAGDGAAHLKLAEAPTTLLGRAWELDDENRGHILRIRPYKPVYILPLFHSRRPNQYPTTPSAGHTVSDSLDLSQDEAKLQISLKTKLAENLLGNNGDLWFGYTQTSRWQVYNGGISRPFRETNHEPEVMLVWRTDYDLAGWRGRFFNLSLNHQSNGQSLPLSRSWNRLMLSANLEKDDWTLSVRPWWRLPESANKDDNPDIANYLGRADINLVRRWGDHQFSVLLRHSLRTGENSRGAVQLDYAFPIAGEMRGHLQWFSGYGESMIDYNHRATYYGLGVSLLEWY